MHFFSAFSNLDSDSHAQALHFFVVVNMQSVVLEFSTKKILGNIPEYMGILLSNLSGRPGHAKEPSLLYQSYVYFATFRFTYQVYFL